MMPKRQVRARVDLDAGQNRHEVCMADAYLRALAKSVRYGGTGSAEVWTFPSLRASVRGRGTGE
jgi:hypothetical protein